MDDQKATDVLTGETVSVLGTSGGRTYVMYGDGRVSDVSMGELQ